MASLGSFSAAVREYDPAAERDEFDFYDEHFVVYGEIPAIVDLTMTAAVVGKATSIDGDAALFEALKAALTIPAREVDGEPVRADDSQFDRFYRLAIRNDAPAELLTTIAYKILGAQVGRPTKRRSISSAGPLPTSTSSNSSASTSPDSPDSRPDAAASAG